MKNFVVRGIDKKTRRRIEHVVAAIDQREALSKGRRLVTDIDSVSETSLQPTVETPRALRSLLAEHEGESIGINWPDPTKTVEAILAFVGDDYFTVRPQNEAIDVNMPFRSIISAIRTDGSVTVPGMLTVTTKSYPLVLRVWDMVIYKGAVGVSWQL